MRIVVALEVDRTEGRQMSAEAVGEEIVGMLEGESVDVEDSTFEITSAEAVAQSRNTGGGGVNIGQLLVAVGEAQNALLDAHPVGSGSVPTTPLERAIERTLWLDGIGPAIVRARAEAQKAKARS